VSKENNVCIVIGVILWLVLFAYFLRHEHSKQEYQGCYREKDYYEPELGFLQKEDSDEYYEFGNSCGTE